MNQDSTVLIAAWVLLVWGLLKGAGARDTTPAG